VRQKRELTGVLGIAADKLRVCPNDVGGNFGTRNRVFVEFRLGALGRAQARPSGQVHRDALGGLLSDYQGRDLVTKVELALAATAASSPCVPTNITMSARAA